MYYCTLTEAPFSQSEEDFFKNIANEKDGAFDYRETYSQTRVLKFGSTSRSSYTLWRNLLQCAILQAREELIAEAEVV